MLPWANTDRIVCTYPYLVSVPAAEELWNHGLCLIGVIQTETQKFLIAYLYNTELQTQGDMRGFLNSPVDRAHSVFGAFLD